MFIPLSNPVLFHEVKLVPLSYETATRISQGPVSPFGQSAQVTTTVPPSLLLTTG